MIIGLTGGIACGKSTVAAIFRRKGFAAFESDVFCSELYDSGNEYLLRAIKDRWGEKYIKGKNPDKAMIASLVFSEKKEREWLNSIIHPMVLEGMKKSAAKNKSELICDVPLLFEVKWEEKFEKIIAVWAPPEQVWERLLLRGYSKDDAEKRLKSQIPNDKKLQMADYGIINSGSLQILESQCETIIQKIKNKQRGGL